MQIEDLLLAHGEWKRQYYRSLIAPRKSRIRLRELRDERSSPLGQWLHGAGRGITAASREYRDLAVLHREFVRRCADILAYTRYGIRLEQTARIRIPFSVLSSRITRILEKIHERKLAFAQSMRKWSVEAG